MRGETERQIALLEQQNENGIPQEPAEFKRALLSHLDGLIGPGSDRRGFLSKIAGVKETKDPISAPRIPSPEDAEICGELPGDAEAEERLSVEAIAQTQLPEAASNIAGTSGEKGLSRELIPIEARRRVVGLVPERIRLHNKRPTEGMEKIGTDTIFPSGTEIASRPPAPKKTANARNDVSYPSINNFFNSTAPALKGHPVDIVTELELIPHEDMDANMAEWARIIALSNKYGLDVNYIFRPNGDLKFAADAKKALLDHIDKLAGFDEEFKNAVKARITDTPRKGKNIITIGIMSLEKVKALQLDELEKGLLPIAMSDGEGAGLPLRDFVAASMIGLSQAACMAAKPEERLETVKNVLPTMQKLYKRLVPKEIVNEETVLTMVAGNPTQRKNIALSLALPPIVRAAIGQLRRVHERIIDILRNA